jgi:hypothetical protein
MTTTRLIFGFLLILIGLSALTGLDIFRIVIPILLIFWGIRVLSGHRGHDQPQHIREEEIAGNDIDEVVVFGGVNKKLTSKQFTGGRCVVVFGGGEIDLRSVASKSKTLELELTSVFAGMRVFVPAGWNIRSEGTGIMGGFANHTDPGQAAKPTLTVRGAAIFGGVEIVN